MWQTSSQAPPARAHRQVSFALRLTRQALMRSWKRQPSSNLHSKKHELMIAKLAENNPEWDEAAKGEAATIQGSSSKKTDKMRRHQRIERANGRSSIV